jgi:sporulation protein YlmC with PRC-barrel domain
MDIPVGVEVHCRDGLCGRSTYVLIDPVRKEVTHLVVKEAASPHEERLVPIEAISETAPDVILLRRSRDELSEMDPFVQTEYIREEMSDLNYVPSRWMGVGSYLVWPYAVPDWTHTVAVEHRHIPLGELAIRRGTVVEATDGRAGHVDEFLVDPENEHITHIVMREGHLWGKKDISIPVSEIDHIEEDVVFLRLNKSEVEALPAIPVRRWTGQ